MELSELAVPERRVDHLRTVEASLRLDSVASAGFKLSRAKMADAVKAGDVRREQPPVPCHRHGRIERPAAGLHPPASSSLSRRNIRILRSASQPLGAQGQNATFLF